MEARNARGTSNQHLEVAKKCNHPKKENSIPTGKKEKKTRKAEKIVGSIIEKYDSGSDQLEFIPQDIESGEVLESNHTALFDIVDDFFAEGGSSDKILFSGKPAIDIGEEGEDEFIPYRTD